MVSTFQNTKQLYSTKFRLSKNDAYFVYFTMEAHEGLCFYSTVVESINGPYRDIDVKCPVELKDDLKELIFKLQGHLRIDILEEEIIQDS